MRKSALAALVAVCERQRLTPRLLAAGFILLSTLIFLCELASADSPAASKSRFDTALQNILILERPGPDGYATFWDGNKCIQCGRTKESGSRHEAAGTLIGEAMPKFDQTPDRPEPFGYKVSWFAVKASDPASVLDALQFREATPANWASGLEAAYGQSHKDDPWVFISPPLSGWVLVVGFSLPYPTIETHHDIGKRFDILFSRLMERFDDVQFFGSYRVVDFTAWARGLKGIPMRVFAWSGSDGTVLANIGEQTPEEAKLGFPDLSGLSPSDAGDRIFELAEQQGAEESALIASGLSGREARARLRQNGRHAFVDETDVVKLAGLWSIDPTQLSNPDHPPGVGLAARLPKDLAQ